MQHEIYLRLQRPAVEHRQQIAGPHGLVRPQQHPKHRAPLLALHHGVLTAGAHHAGGLHGFAHRPEGQSTAAEQHQNEQLPAQGRRPRAGPRQEVVTAHPHQGGWQHRLSRLCEGVAAGSDGQIGGWRGHQAAWR